MKYKYNNQWVDLSIKALDSMVIGSIIQFMGTTIPTGWLECNGGTITQSEYPELYDLIGGTLPDFRGRVLVGQDTNDTDFDTLGETGGSKDLQEHMHKGFNVDGTITRIKNGSAGGIALNFEWSGAGSEIGTGNAGSGNSGNLQPYAVVKHIIKALNTTPTMASIVNGYSTSTQDGYSCSYVNNLQPKILWTNPNPANNFDAQDITLNSDDYDMYEVLYRNKTVENLYSSEKAMKGSGVLLKSIKTNVQDYTMFRDIEPTNNTKLHVYPNYMPGIGADNEYGIPVYVIGYKLN